MPRSHQSAPLDSALAPPFGRALVIDKPQVRTSHDVVDAARRILGFRQIGHLGTLDPLATGVLVLLLGRATRQSRRDTRTPETLHVHVPLRFATDMYDSDGSPVGPDTALPNSTAPKSRAWPLSASADFRKCLRPIPQKKFTDVRARAGEKEKPVELKSVEIEVYGFPRH